MNISFVLLYCSIIILRYHSLTFHLRRVPQKVVGIVTGTEHSLSLRLLRCWPSRLCVFWAVLSFDSALTTDHSQSLEPSLALTIVHFDGTSVLSLHSIQSCSDLSNSHSTCYFAGELTLLNCKESLLTNKQACCWSLEQLPINVSKRK